MPRFSIVVPVYNVAPYLREFLDSVLAQTESDWEAICVDDGSTDESGKILDEYANKDSRFGIVHQENGGVSVARNAGLERVRGEWFFIVDPDDILGSDYIHELYGLVKDVGGGATIAAIGWKTFVDGEPRDKSEICRPSIEDGEYRLKATGFHFQTGGLWNKIYPASMLKREPKTRFAKGCSLGEDSVFLMQFLNYADKIIVAGNRCQYYYRLRSSSLCHGLGQVNVAMNYWKSTLALKNDLCGESQWILREWMIRAMYGHMTSLGFSDLCCVLRQMEDDGVEAWETVFLPEAEEDKIFRNWKHSYAQVYAKVILSRQPIRLKALELLFVDYYRRLLNRLVH